MSTSTLTTHDALALAVQTYGPADAPVAVVLSHCWTSDHEDWHYQVEALQDAFGHGVRVVTYDHRGHGASQESPEAACTIANLGRDLGDVIDAYAPTGRLVLAGHSIGGMTMMALAEQRPELYADRVAGALFTSTAAAGLDDVTLGLPELGPVLKAQIPRMLALRARTLSKKQRRRLPWIERQVTHRFLFGSPIRMRDAALATEGIINSPAATMCGFYADLMHHDRTAALAVLDDVPVHVTVGSADKLTPPRYARQLAAAIHGARLTVAPGAGHMLPLERHELVSDRLLELVTGALLESAGPAPQAARGTGTVTAAGSPVTAATTGAV